MDSENIDSSGFSNNRDGFHPPLHNHGAASLQQNYLDAIRGEFVPKNFNELRMTCSIIHGLRYNESFAESESMKEICAKSSNKIFARARNARLIMSNKIPLMTDVGEKPYCIWHPQLATADTYRELAQRYPDMKYHVGRACAVGGYIDLYRELDLLPDISIAEEAWHNSDVAGSKEIFDFIACQPTRYAILDDYTRSVNLQAPRIAMGLNGDTALLSSLNVTFDVWKEWEEARSHYFNITEDHGVSETSSAQAHGHPLAPEHVSLLYNPLPINLPTTNKDTLILHAAYEGNVDRYVRLRRPVMVKGETEAIVRGIYHHTSFARWCHGQLESGFANKCDCWDIKRATLARFIMVNDLSRITSTTETSDKDQSMPFMIWWPLIPQEATLRELARRRTDMGLQVAMACIVADYHQLWSELTPEPHALLWYQAAQQEEDGANLNKNFYVEYLERRAAEKGIDLQAPAWDCSSLYDCLTRDKEPTTIFLQPQIQVREDVPVNYNTGSIYPGRAQANMAEWDLCIAVSDDLREQARTENVDDNLNENWGWPYSCWEAQASYNGA
ncbi:hypothetical protein BTUL_0192g00130 [Botrytis tulipae]|uniref:Ig-like domain-containing protein n=1 Tax=Botrytis tulipae TaxID=87230 RepID=A0A4Z1EC55_9HELO|nr:hypothetical protein BTUL_0192g00130 [Botrytis tulipae]